MAHPERQKTIIVPGLGGTLIEVSNPKALNIYKPGDDLTQTAKDIGTLVENSPKLEGSKTEEPRPELQGEIPGDDITFTLIN